MLFIIRFCFVLAALSLIWSDDLHAQSSHGAQDAVRSGVKWNFDYRNFQGRIKVYEVPQSFAWELGENFTFREKEPLPFKNLAPEVIPMKRRQRKTLALVIQNTTEEPWYFFANFHKIYPIEKSFGVTLTCLCNNHIFEVKPKTSWARIVQVRTYGEFRDKILDLRHDVVGITKLELAERRLHGHLEADETIDTATPELKSQSSPGQSTRPASGRSQ